MLNIVLVIIAVAAILVFFKYISKPNYAFIVTITTGKCESTYGQVPKGFISDCSHIVKGTNVTGNIYCEKRNGSASLKFSKEIPQNLHQRFRNVFPFDKF